MCERRHKASKQAQHCFSYILPAAFPVLPSLTRPLKRKKQFQSRQTPRQHVSFQKGGKQKRMKLPSGLDKNGIHGIGSEKKYGYPFKSSVPTPILLAYLGLDPHR